MPHGLVGVIAIFLGFWGLFMNWWAFTEILLGLVPLILILSGTVAIIAGVKLVREGKSEGKKEGKKAKKAEDSLPQFSNMAVAKSTPGSIVGYRNFKIITKTKETHNVSSFYLQPEDGEALTPFLPGQYLTFQLNVPDQDKPVVRCYSLSSGSTNLDYYRVTIKRQEVPHDLGDVPPGKGSNFFHDHLNEGDVVTAKPPKGNFYLDMEATTPIVLIAGGVGMTPMLSMLESVIAEKQEREIWFLMGVRNKKEYIMREELEALASQNKNVHLKVFFSKPGIEDFKDKDYDFSERISVKRLKKLLPSNNFDYYICAPSSMIDEIRKDLEKWEVPKNQIHYESFGQATIKKAVQPKPVPEEKSVQINFSKSSKTIAWKDSYDSLLDLAEDNGIEIESGCRTGSCGSCEVACTSGSVIYLDEPDYEPEKGNCLACVSIPKGNISLDA